MRATRSRTAQRTQTARGTAMSTPEQVTTTSGPTRTLNVSQTDGFDRV